MIFTIEPMVNADRHDVKVLSDGCDIFTLSPTGYAKPPYPPEPGRH